MTGHLFEKITIIGLGLIGGSIARAAHERSLAGIIIGCDRNEVSLAYGRKHGFITTAMRDPAAAVGGSQLVIVATPPASLGEIAKIIGPKLMPGAIVMDMCSVKQPAMEAMACHLPDHAEYVPAHPIAGSEQSGVSAGRADLFERRRVIVTPGEPLSDTVLQQVNAFWRGMGARVEAMPPHLHDMVYAHVSHLPQLLAFAAGPLVEKAGPSQEILQKFLRLATSSPALWSEILTMNKENIINSLDKYLDVISHIRGELMEAPESSGAQPDPALAGQVLFPRIAASCLVTNTMAAEKKAGFPFARYAGAGFADFIAPVIQPPEKDMERVSDHYPALLPVLDAYIERLKTIRATLASGNMEQLEAALIP